MNYTNENWPVSVLILPNFDWAMKQGNSVKLRFLLNCFSWSKFDREPPNQGKECHFLIVCFFLINKKRNQLKLWKPWKRRGPVGVKWIQCKVDQTTKKGSRAKIGRFFCLFFFLFLLRIVSRLSLWGSCSFFSKREKKVPRSWKVSLISE